MLDAFAAFNRRDWDALDAVLAEDLAAVDHRRLGFPPGDGREALTGQLRALVDQVPDVVAVVAAIGARGRVAPVLTHQFGTATTSSQAEWDWLLVITLGADERIDRMEYFDVDDAEHVAARVAELVAGRPPASSDAASSVTELLDPIAAAFAARDWDLVRARLAPDVELVDRRSTVSSDRTVGPDGIVELFRGFADVGFDSIEQGLLDIRGQHLALVRRTYRSSGGDELEMLVVAETDAEHRARRVVLFDPDDLAAARAEFDARGNNG